MDLWPHLREVELDDEVEYDIGWKPTSRQYSVASANNVQFIGAMDTYSNYRLIWKVCPTQKLNPSHDLLCKIGFGRLIS
jgi:hypothetical protein